ncbi:universal stress protein [Actinoplanes sp. OR16]|uniref:universal stress protein n=1 Tax=Actinoplanes sp. OR16 TaxID=946334 RepID=UPI000F6B60A6|nr:universal stress protein [Actinoplanes sp. OR16]BBH71284.1 universal stress protein [Actinoplanes sp. OR16]
MQDPVVVGVDGSAAGRAAVRLAAREAVTRGSALNIIHAFTWHETTGYAPARGAASRVVKEAVAYAQRSTPGVDARGQLRDGPPLRILTEMSRRACLLVVGGDGLALLGAGSVVRDLVPRAWCPVALARGPRPPTGPVVAALDSSEFSLVALRFAAAEAALRGSKLIAVEVTRSGQASPAVAKIVEDFPARLRVLTGPPGPTLVRATRRAGLIVLGPRGEGGARRLGSVATEVLRHGCSPAVFAHAGW